MTRQLALLLSVGFVAAWGCASLGDFRRFFLTRCPATGPVREHRFDVHVEPVDMSAYYARLHEAAGGLGIREVARVNDGCVEWPIYHVGPLGPPGTKRVLIIAGIHGNEIAASLAAVEILRDFRANREMYGPVEIHLVAPANPVGLAHQSRYNAAGCDLNRDFGQFGTAEARAIRDVFAAVRPALLISLHEGPQDGFFVIGTASAPPQLAGAVAKAVATQGIVLATRNFLGLPLRKRGFETEGGFKSALKRLIGLGSLGTYADQRDVGTLTTESPWSGGDIALRIRAQVAAVRAAARGFSDGA
jgi:hypothetical protein